ncbi:arginine deiminase family protein, partial [Staphylococcus epidermidis]|uniref:arginine deiminase family protein n=1 Tax=Staphylococcus epidermidis TaxID=1282 RepID=UPI0021B2FFBC
DGRFKDENIGLWVDRECGLKIEGGEEVVLCKDVVGIGICEGSCGEGIEGLGGGIFKNGLCSFKKVVGIEIASSGRFMELDSVCRMID